MGKISQENRDFYHDAQLVELCKKSIRAALNPCGVYVKFLDHHSTTIQVAVRQRQPGTPHRYLGTLKALAEMPESALVALLEEKQDEAVKEVAR